MSFEYRLECMSASKTSRFVVQKCGTVRHVCDEPTRAQRWYRNFDDFVKDLMFLNTRAWGSKSKNTMYVYVKPVPVLDGIVWC